MNAQRLLAYFERIADTPDAIDRLRRFILDLAVRGKLVPQDPTNEPASEILRRIASEKIGPFVATADSNETESIPFGTVLEGEPPVGWVITTLRKISSRIHYGYTASADTTVTDVKMVRITDVQDNTVAWSSVPGCVIDLKSVDQYKLEAGDLLIARTGGTVGKSFLVREVPFTSVFASYLIRVQGTRHVLADYVKLFLESSLYWDQLREGTRGTGQPNVNSAVLGRLILPIPPYAEQHRIVGRVNELMALCDRLEAARAERDKKRNRLTLASFARLNTPDPDPAKFATDARVALSVLPVLAARRDQIQQLRQTILNLAIRGALVPQDPSDEPALDLLRRAAIEKARLAQAGHIRSYKPRNPPSSADVPFDLPGGWQPAYIEEVLNDLQTGPFGSSLHQSDYQIGGTPVINPASIQIEGIVPIDNMAVGPLTLERLSSFKLRAGDIVMGRRGEMGRCALVSEKEHGWLCGTGSLILRPSRFVHSRFIVLLIGSPFVRAYLAGSAVGTTMQNLNQAILLKLAFGLPPAAEQRRIVAKVDELMALCDRLEASLTTADTTRSHLLDALLADALAPVASELLATN